MAQGLAAPSETAAPSSTAPGLPKDTDRIVRELDVYLCNGELGAGTQASGGSVAAVLPAACSCRLSAQPLLLQPNTSTNECLSVAGC